MLEMSDEEPEPAEPPPAPTTSALPKKDKHIRRKPEAVAAAAEPEADEPLHIGRRRKRDWEEDEGGKSCWCLHSFIMKSNHGIAHYDARRFGCGVGLVVAEDCA